VGGHDYCHRWTGSIGQRDVGEATAAHFGLRHLDTGLIYRGGEGRARPVIRSTMAACAGRAARALGPLRFDEKALKNHKVGEAGLSCRRSRGAGGPARFQRVRPHPAWRGAGRPDIGTVIFPDADIKIFVTARPEVRARRRHWSFSRPCVQEATWLATSWRRDERDSGPGRRAAENAHRMHTCSIPRFGYRRGIPGRIDMSKPSEQADSAADRAAVMEDEPAPTGIRDGHARS